MLFCFEVVVLKNVHKITEPNKMRIVSECVIVQVQLPTESSAQRIAMLP